MTTKKLQWRSHLPDLMKEMLEGNPSGSALVMPVNITMGIIASVAKRAAELDDPELNVLMLRLALYDVPVTGITEAIEAQEARLNEDPKPDPALALLIELASFQTTWQDVEDMPGKVAYARAHTLRELADRAGTILEDME